MLFTRLIALGLLAVILVACSQGGGDTSDIKPIREAYAKGFYLEARSGYERYLQLYPKGEFRLEAWERLLEIAMNVSGNMDQAISLLEAMILEFGHENEAAWDLMNRLADMYEQNNQRTQALAALEKSLDFSADDPGKTIDTRMHMARLYRTEREYDLAVDLLKRCVEEATDPKLRAECLYEEAQTYSYMQSWGQAKEVLEVIVKEKQADEAIYPQAVFLLADVYEQELNYPKARALFESIKETYPNPKVIEIRLQNLGKDKL
ncbi:MAG: DUF3808 domain-containing protein [Proteobacteria bacterium]|nr:DUF3808 domain-containing protein [Pseudomonadota bacterium]MBU1612564.1 DUF3808 domain-containing protein [Pseudomonadota bacterium]